MVRRYDTGKVQVHALRGVDLTIERGEMVAIMGPSGCGKTPLLHRLSGLDEIDEGDVQIEGVSLPRGSPEGPPDRETVCGLGNRKDVYFVAQAETEGVRVYEGTVHLIRQLRANGVRTAIFSASRHAESVLLAAGASDLFDDRIDGVLAEKLQLPGKPSPAVVLELTRRLKSTPERSVVLRGCDRRRAGGACGRVRAGYRHQLGRLSGSTDEAGRRLRGTRPR